MASSIYSPLTGRKYQLPSTHSQPLVQRPAGLPQTGALPGLPGGQPLGTTPLTQERKDEITKGAQPTLGSTTFKPQTSFANDLRFQSFTPGTAPSFTDAYTELGKAVLGGKQQIAGTDLTSAREALGRSSGEISGARLGDKKEIAKSDYSGVQGLYDKSMNEVERANIGQYGTINPTDLTKSYGLLDQAMAGVNGVSIEDLVEIAPGQYAVSPEAARSREITMQFLESLSSAPNRGDLASQTFDLMRERSAPQYEQDLRSVGQKAAALGRTKAGMTTNELTDVWSSRERDLLQAQTDLGLRAADLEMSDRLNQLGYASDVGGRFKTEDIQDADMQMALRDEARRERADHGQRDVQQADLALNRADAQRLGASTFADLGFRANDERFRERDFEFGADATRADLALGRAGALQNLGGRQQDLLSAQRGELERDRSYGLDYDTRSADLALGRSGAYGNIASREADFASLARRDAEVDRDYGFQHELAGANLATGRAGMLADLEQQIYGNEEASKEAFRRERGYQADMAQQEYLNWLEEKKLGLTLGIK